MDFIRIIATHTLLHAERARVKMSHAPIEDNRRYGYSLFAKEKLPAGTMLWEVLGLMPFYNDDPPPTPEANEIWDVLGSLVADNGVQGADSSLISVSACKYRRPGASQILYGPIRMVAQRCESYNCEVRAFFFLVILFANEEFACSSLTIRRSLPLFCALRLISQSGMSLQSTSARSGLVVREFPAFAATALGNLFLAIARSALLRDSGLATRFSLNCESTKKK